MLFVVVSLRNLGTFGWKKEMFIITVDGCNPEEERQHL